LQRTYARFAGAVASLGAKDSNVELVVRPIGIVRSPFDEKVEAPRQAITAADTTGTVEIHPEYRDALADLEGFDRIWILFWFSRAEGWRSKVQPPRSDERRGLFATRAPHRPNPIGMSPVRLERVDGLVLHVRELDILDGTPVIDIKPYLPYCDAFGEARAGWLETRDARSWRVQFSASADERLGWIALQNSGGALRERISSALELGPQPHAYSRLKKLDDGSLLLAVKDWRVQCRVAEGQTILVESVRTGYRPRDLATGAEPAHALHRAFVGRFG
jgi:tRNA (adenine37-N6)-methyltransferase